MKEESPSGSPNVQPSVRAGGGPGGAAYMAVPGQGGSTSDDEINLRELFDLVWSGRWTVVGVTFAAMLVGVLYAVTATPIYVASGLVQVEEDQQSLSDSLNKLSSMLAGSTVQTSAEIAIITSRMVLGEVAERLNLRIVVEPKTFPRIGKAYLRRQNSDGGLHAPLLGLNRYAWGGERLAVTAFEPPGGFQDRAFTVVATESGFVLKNAAGEELLEGRPGEAAHGELAEGPIRIFVQELIARPGTEFTLVQRSQQSMYQHLKSRVSVSEQSKDSGIIQIAYQAESPRLAAQVVNAIEEAYLQQNVERRSEEAQQSLDFLKKQLPDVKAKVDAAQAKLNDYQGKQGSADVQKETELVLDQAVALETERLTLTQQREQALQRFTVQHPAVLVLNEQIRSIETELKKIQAQVAELPERQQEIFSLMRDLEVNTQLYIALLNSSQELQVAKAGTVGNVRIIDTALEPRQPSKPKKTLIVLVSTLVGGFLGIVVIFLQRALLRGVDRPEDVERALGLSTYASIPFSDDQKRLSMAVRGKKTTNGILAVLHGADSSIEALRSLRASLHFAMLESDNNVVMITGPVPMLGKSFVSVNLAAVLALAGKKVVLVDGDLRRGHLHNYLGEGSGPGVSEFVAGVEGDLQKVVRPSSVEGLSFVAKGASPPNPAEVLMHERFADLIRQLSQAFDYVIIDTPPVLPVADASIIGRLAGVTFIVLKAAEHPIRTIEETVRRLKNAGVEVRGVIFNQVGAKVGSYGYGHYGYSYGYGSYSYRSQ